MAEPVEVKWAVLMTLSISASESGLIAVTADEPKGLLVTGHSLAEVLERVPGAIYELMSAGAKAPRLERFTPAGV
jgi:hypothetical protein